MRSAPETQNVGLVPEFGPALSLEVGIDQINGPGVLTYGLVVVPAFDVDVADGLDHVCQLEEVVLVDALVGLGSLSRRRLRFVQNAVLLQLRLETPPLVVVLGLGYQCLRFQHYRPLVVNLFQSYRKGQNVFQ